MTGIDSGILASGTLTDYPTLRDRARRAAQLFIDMGVRPGDSVALLARNDVAGIEATLGAQHIGAYAVPINWHLSPSEVAYIMQDCGARVLVARSDLLERLGDMRPANIHCLTFGGPADAPSAGTWDAALARTAPSSAPPAPPLSAMIYTSGTTGRPKGVRRAPVTAANADTARNIRTRLYASRPAMRVLLSAPLYHTAPLLFALGAIASEGLLILESKFDAEATLRAIETHRLTHLYMVPTMFVRLLALPAETRARFDLSSLEWVLHAGGPCAPDVKRAMIDWWGPVLAEYYGSTEMGPLTFVDAADWLTKPGTVGRPLPGVAIDIRDEAGGVCPPLVPGEVNVARNCQPDFTYHGDEAKRRALQRPFGLATGDIGYLDEDGYLFISDRRTDLILSGGVNIYPAEIEAALIGLDYVADCAVVGKADPEYGESIVAFLQLEAGADRPDDGAIIASLRPHLAGYKIPRTFIWLDALPRDPSGKIFKRRLREQVDAPPPAS